MDPSRGTTFHDFNVIAVYQTLIVRRDATLPSTSTLEDDPQTHSYCLRCQPLRSDNSQRSTSTSIDDKHASSISS